MEKKSRVIIKKIIEELKGRGGFDGWWGCVDDDIQNEIKEKLKQIVIDNS